MVVEDGARITDVLINSGRIERVGRIPPSVDVETFDARGKIIIPGGVDVHTHMDTPFMGAVTSDDHASASRAAAVGGTTTYVDYAFQRSGERLPEVLARWAGRAGGRSAIDFSFHLAVTSPYPDLVADMALVVADGVTSFKVFMAYKGLAMLDDGQLFTVLTEASRLGATLCVHAENGHVIDVLAERLIRAGKTGPLGHLLSRPPETEVEAVRRGIMLANLADAPLYFVHLSTAGAVAAVAEAQSAGRPISGETCTHYLLLDEGLYHEPGFEAAKYVVSPPLRGREHREELWRGLREGTLAVVSSDHCPFCMAGQKTLGVHDFRRIPNGAPGIEHRVPLLYGHGVRSGRLSLERFVDVVSTGPARRFGLYPTKGVIRPGADADLVVIDPQAASVVLAQTMTQDCDYTPFERWHVPGRIDSVYLRGELVARRGRFVGRQDAGRFLPRRAA
ncbi:dihydropyrimidinase [Micromonospora sp. HM134]|uniref:dihydropyrimidinase n=1 Tax=Micromonospora sp. HM134 TaxID=2583243 RepID=UPI00143CD544|nr:dihydropyrimidinase [Micromonospora sp. HM134]